MSGFFAACEKVRSYPSVSGSLAYLNLGPQYVVSNALNMDVLSSELESFRALQKQWFCDLMISETDHSNRAGHRQIFGLRGSVTYQLGIERFALQRFKSGSFDADAWSILSDFCKREDIGGHLTLGLGVAPTSIQIEFMRKALNGRDVLCFTNYLRPHLISPFVFTALELALAESSSPDDFVKRVCKLAAKERAPQSLDDPAKDGSRIKSAIPDAFLFYLCQRGLLLRPIEPRVFCSDTQGLDQYLMDPEVRDLWQITRIAFAATSRNTPVEAASKSHKNKMLRRERDLLQVFRIIISSSTVRAPELISSDLFEDLFEKFDEAVGSRSTPDMLSRVFKAMRDRLPLEQQGPVFESRRTKWGERDRFDWTRMVYDASTRTRFPEGFVGPYIPKPSVLAWTEALTLTLTKVGTKNVGNHKATCNVFLLWLVVSGNDSCGVASLTREDMNDGKSPNLSDCFRAFLMRREITSNALSAHMSRLAHLFDYMISELDTPVPNPIVLRFDVKRAVVNRGKTPRRSLGREMLDYIREFNARDEFAFSKGRPAHYRVLIDRASMNYEKVWFPGVARALDFLLRLPLRGFQVRYLDSGEGDEFIPDLSKPSAAMLRNTSPLATKGRRQGVLALIDSLQGEPILGLYVNTNKTGVDCNEGYEIPWCEDGLRDGIIDLVAWQRRWNPIQQPVMCVEKNQVPTNQDVTAAIVRTYALFRDPSEPDGWPVSRDAIYRFWDDLCAAVEDELNATSDDGKALIRLTDTVVINKGRGKRERRRVARYDIHTLRVSGISALIEAGMPPDLVAQVAGHSSIVMTLYYNVIAASALNERLKGALLRTATDLDALDGFRTDEFEKVAEFLVNRRSTEDAAGLAMLRERMGHGDGTFNVMSHGICPGGECSSGGEWSNQAVGHLSVPRTLACSLCRYRLTGPMFLPGLVLNANRLMHELRRKGQEIADLNAERQALDPAQSKRAATLKGRIEALYKETGTIAEEWSAEVQYVHAAKDLLDAYMAANASASNDAPLPAIMGAQEQGVTVAKLEARSDFALLQSLSEGASSWVEFRPTAALADHREFLNEVLAANEIDPFLLRLSGKARDEAANLLGRALTSMVPDSEIDGLRDEDSLRTRYPAVLEVVTKLQTESRLALSQSQVRPLGAGKLHVDLDAVLQHPLFLDVEAGLIGRRHEFVERHGVVALAVYVWDTVAALANAVHLTNITGGDHRFLDANLRKTSRFIYHAMAIDENREIYNATLLTHYAPQSEGYTPPRQITNVEQRWFCGSHGNVGGGNYSDLAAQIPLQWMMTKAKQHGLCFRQENIDIEPTATKAALYDSFKANDIPDLLQQVLLQHGSRFWREIDREPETLKTTVVHTVNETIDKSVFERCRLDPTYKPANLVAWAKKHNVTLANLTKSVLAVDPSVDAPE